jgi:hypothetical protein
MEGWRRLGGAERMEDTWWCREDGGDLVVQRGWRRLGGAERMEETWWCREDGGDLVVQEGWHSILDCCKFTSQLHSTNKERKPKRIGGR